MYFVVFRDIQQKKRVIAEKIETVTVFYSDLVNFNELYTDSSPIEVGFNRQYYCVLLPWFCGRW